eukprot:scaffold189_cov249-Pinguiococcus_pyrenoidosus.AAC.11
MEVRGVGDIAVQVRRTKEPRVCCRTGDLMHKMANRGRRNLAASSRCCRSARSPCASGRIAALRPSERSAWRRVRGWRSS